MKRSILIVLCLFFTFASTNEAGREEIVVPQASHADAAMVGSTPPQRGGQVGATCVANPYCPECDGRGNVCRTVKEFFPGITVLAAKRYMIDKCRRANGLDYCGGSYGCVRQKNWTPRDGERHRAKYGGGCYKSCDKAVTCYIDNR
jgi:hypothetical protein